MSTHAGLQRVAKALRYVGAFVSIALVVGGLELSGGAFTPADHDFILWGGTLGGIAVALISYGVAWIIDGFAGKK
jgi:hypothetical protein